MKRFQIIAGILAAACLVLIGVFTAIQLSLGGRLDTQSVRSRWVSDGARYAQLSVFIAPQAELDDLTVERSLKESIDSALVDASISAADDDARLCAWAYSSEQTMSLSRLSPETGATVKSGVSATTMGVGGDFFLFHRMKLLSGWYFDPTDPVQNDSVVIDNIIAWQFFGSPEVVGQELLVNGRRCYISGVVDVDKDYRQFCGENGRIYMSYSLMKELSGDSLPITAYEICMPDPVGGFAKSILEKSIGIDPMYAEIVENSDRFTDGGLLERLKTFSERSVRTKLVAYPYWENTAVILVDRAALLYIGKLIPIAVLVLLAATEIVIGYINRKRFYRFVGTKVGSAWEKHLQNRRLKARKRLEAARLAEAKKIPALVAGAPPEPLIGETPERAKISETDRSENNG